MFHKSTFGSFGGNLRSDMDGYVPEANDGPFGGNWDHGTERTHDETGELTEYGKWWAEEGFQQLQSEAAAATKEAQEALTEWQAQHA